MRKLAIAVAFSLLLVAAVAGTALADNGPHGGAQFSSATTDACASCHRAHTAKATTDLLAAASEEALCLSCHDGTGAYTNVVDGVYAGSISDYTLDTPYGTQGDAGVGLFAGGFTHTKSSPTWTGKVYWDSTVTASQHDTTSTHSVDGTTVTTWGSGAYNSVAGTMALECTSCHDPHGYAGKDASGKSIPSYRILRYTPSGSNGYEASSTSLFTTKPSYVFQVTGSETAGATVTEPTGTLGTGYKATSWWYTINTVYSKDPTIAGLKKPYGWADGSTTPWISLEFGSGDYGPYGRGATYKRPAITASSGYLCYDVTGSLPTNPPATAASANDSCASGTVAAFSGVDKGTAFDNTNGRYGMAYFCAQCHDRYLASSSSRSTDSGDTDYMFRHNGGGGSTNPSLTCVDCHNAHGTSAASTTLTQSAQKVADSALLKLDNRSMCARCHGTSVNFQFTAP